MSFLSIKKPVIFGFLAGSILLIAYFLILFLANSFSHAISQFLGLWYLILPLVVGFGIQVFLYSCIYYQIKETKEKKLRSAKGELVANGGISIVSMIACCAHHLTDVAPLLGLSVLFAFLANYQMFFLLLGISSNIFGIIMMLEIIKKMNLLQKCRIFEKLNQWNWGRIKILAVVILLFVLLISFLVIKNKENKNFNNSNLTEKNQNQIINLSTKNNSAGGLSIDVTPVDFSFGKTLQFEIVFNTHQDSLDFNLIKISYVLDDKNNKYLPESWQGGGGGHHLSGILVFPSIPEKVEQIKLVMKDIYKIPTREFIWLLK